ncbi:tRNA1(Val) (adenine(37)-N6)-methyltransferase [Fulvivirga sediminis]|uniref:tRNA1(Val) (adenine(37)-N6)-methyltransferase n=1 Tax=Fulvivirga sediminis TaxID=2803949 RepID=A0A937F7Y5_9BACT|nr:methyltransferase [Fulvivirga sediminis]MBL3658112.1 methyltransferase [Fulvivirga sediminis]
MRRKHQFDFKQFSIIQENTAMKVGTDGVLLGAWATVDAPEKVLDIGTGTGLIALMIAQRCNQCKIEAIDVSEAAAAEASMNFQVSPWSDRLSSKTISIQELSNKKERHYYDLIISNPPYFEQGGTKAQSEGRQQARHNHTLSQEELLNSVNHLLTPQGKFSVILPYQEGLSLIEKSNDFELFINRKTGFFSKERKPQERWLLEFSKVKKAPIEDSLIHYTPSNEWTTPYKLLTKDFYIKL